MEIVSVQEIVTQKSRGAKAGYELKFTHQQGEKERIT